MSTCCGQGNRASIFASDRTASVCLLAIRAKHVANRSEEEWRTTSPTAKHAGLRVTPDTRHQVKRADEARYEVPAGFLSHSSGFRRWAVVDHTTPAAVHTGFGLNELADGGSIDLHVHSFEETFFVLGGHRGDRYPRGGG